MKKILLLLLLCMGTGVYAQIYRIVEAPIAFLRDEPKVTATILVRLEEKTRVKVVDQSNKNWSKVEYMYNSQLLIGYITKHTLSEEAIIRKKTHFAE